MSRRAPAFSARAWLGAAAGSVAIHALVLLALVRGDATPRSRERAAMAAGAALSSAVEPDWIDVVSPDDLRDVVSASAPPLRPAALEADERRDRARAIAPRIADGRERRAPAPDRGVRAGRVDENLSWRRDRSTLHAQLTDGASTSQPARLDTGLPSASPQAVRREPVVGPGDAVRSETPASVPSAPQRAAPDESPAADSARSASGERAAVVVAEAEFPRRADTASTERGVGPLDAERGSRSFDSAARGAPGDDHRQRAASNEMRPGITDLSRAGVRAHEPTLSGRGPGDAPGAVDRPSAGKAPAELGLPRAQQVGAEAAGPTQDRRYDLYIKEITRRVNSLRQFPKRLALRLEQGETVVRFVVDVDGRLRSGVQVMKSSGFDEFDLEAAHAVERAAPFPPLPPALATQALPVSMRVAFENPLVR